MSEGNPQRPVRIAARLLRRGWPATWVVLGLAAVAPAWGGLPSAPVEQWRFVPRLYDPVFRYSQGTCLVLPMLDTNASGTLDASDDPSVLCAHEDFDSNVLHTILEGRDGSPRTTSTPRFVSGAILSAGDIDGDGWNEYVSVGLGGTVHAFRDDGTTLWERTLPERNVGYAALSLCDLDQDGLVDVVTGRCALMGDGTSWLGTAGRGTHSNAGMAASVPCDMDATSPGLEVVAGNTLYDAAGRVLWTSPDVPDGLPAVADFNGDGVAEIALCTEVDLHLLSATGALLGSRRGVIPVGIFGAAPVAADLTGDGRPEIVVACEVTIAAYQWTGVTFDQLWSQTVRVNGSHPVPTAFDFDCDGAAEIVYRDEDQWYIFDGRDGSILYQEPFPSGTIVEMPVVANIDDDPWAEIIVPSEGLEVRVYEVPGSATPRSIFNQATYHATNVLDSGAIPRFEQPSWLAGNSHLAQIPADLANPCGQPCPAVEPGIAEARDASPCLRGIELTWTAATFPSGAGTYSVYRADDTQGLSCDAALALGPIALGLVTERFFDDTTDPARQYAYVVLAEDSAPAPAGCTPVGPDAGGVVATTCLAGPVVDVGGADPPMGIGSALRVFRSGNAALLSWQGARALLPGEHAHVHRALDDATSSFVQVAPEGLLSRELVDAPPSPLAFYDVRVANACEEESAPE